MHTALWQLVKEFIILPAAPLNTGMDRQASLDVSLLSRSFTASDLKRTHTAQSKKSRASSRLAQARSAYGLPARGSTASLRLNTTFTPSLTSAVPPRPPRPPPLRLLQHLRLSISTALSDSSELQRDMATYEYLFLRSTNVLPSLASLCEFVPSILTKAEATDTLTRDTVRRLLIGVADLSKLEEPQMQPTRLLKQVRFQLRPPTVHRNLRLLFKGVREVSGWCCFLQIRCNGWFTAFEVQAVLLDGHSLKLKLPHSLAGLSSNVSVGECTRKVQEQLIRKLFFTVVQGDLALSYDADYGQAWQKFVVKVKGAGWIAVQVFPEGRLAVAGLEELTVPSGLAIKQTGRYVQKCLYLSKGRLQWSVPASRFAAKEADSLLLDAAYVTEKLGTHLSGHITEYSLGPYQFSLELHTRAGLEQVTISRGEDARAVDVEKLKALQFMQLRTAWTTALRSLELQLCTKRLFADLFPD